MRRSLLALALAALLTSPATAQITPFPAGPTNQSGLALIAPTPASPTENSNRIATTQWVNNFVGAGLPLASGKIWIGSVGNIATPQTPSGDCTFSVLGVVTCTQAAGNFQVIGNLTVGGSIIDGNGILATNIVAPATPAAGTTRIYVDSTTKTLSAKNDAGTVSNAVVPSSAVANQFLTGIGAAGVVTRAQPNFTDLAGQGSCAQEPAMTGDVTSSAGTCALAIGTNKVTRAMEAQGVARSVIGVAGNATANVADIQGTTANTFLGVNAAGNGLAFAVPALSSLTNSLGSDVALSNTGTYFDGPSVAQGSTGTWYASGTVTLVDVTAASPRFDCKLWDGTTVIDATSTTPTGTGNWASIALSGFLATPAGNLRISCKESATTGNIHATAGDSTTKGSTISAFRIN